MVGVRNRSIGSPGDRCTSAKLTIATPNRIGTAWIIRRAT
jgi:hypothetical protein